VLTARRCCAGLPSSLCRILETRLSSRVSAVLAAGVFVGAIAVYVTARARTCSRSHRAI
jgi:hypothetical protein